ncbi:MAG: ribosome maturation factor RimP [Erysipelotrichaceae bacterium]
MDQLTKIEDLVKEILATHELQLYEVSWNQENNMRILRIAIMKSDGTMDIDVCASMSEAISLKLDEADFITGEYYLEVCSPGAERELRSLEDIKGAIGEYVYIKLKNVMAKGLFEVYGTLSNIENDMAMIEYMEKAVHKKVMIELDNISLIRLAVKF